MSSGDKLCRLIDVTLSVIFLDRSAGASDMAFKNLISNRVAFASWVVSLMVCLAFFKELCSQYKDGKDLDFVVEHNGKWLGVASFLCMYAN